METAILIAGYLYIAIAVIFSITILRGIIKKEKFTARDNARFLIIALMGLAYIITLAFQYSGEIGLSEKLQILLTFGLVAVTTFYAWSAFRQADANVKMAEEMKEQRYSESLPLLVPDVIQKGVAGKLEPNEVDYQTLQVGVGMEVIWHNLGKGVAINSRFSFWSAPLDNPPGKVLYFRPSESTFLKIEGQKEIKIGKTWAGESLDQSNARSPRLEAEYLDIYERKITTVQEFRIDEQNKKAFLGELYFTINGRRLEKEVTHHD